MVARALVMPFVGILLKWIIVGRFRAGRYRLWGSYYLRWWFVNQTLRFCGRGFFDLSDGWRCRYYRLLGAKIGVNVRLSEKVYLDEADLVCVGDDVTIDVPSSLHASDEAVNNLTDVFNIKSRSVVSRIGGG